jgi:hypothetical protein
MVVMSEKKPSIDFSNQRLIRIATIVALTAAIVSLVVAAFVGASPGFNAISPVPMTAFSGGTFEASGVAHVPGTDAVLFVDDGRPNEIFLMRLGDDRKQEGEIKSIDIGTSIIDLEGITTDGGYYYVVGSQSKSKGADLVGLARFKFDAANQRTIGTESASGLKKFLADNVAELRGMENTKYNDGGINVEGIAWDPRNKRLLLGLRSPVVEGHALVIPLKLRDPQAAFSFDNLEVEGKKAIRLSLNGAGIRSIEFDESRRAFHVITGAGPNSEKMDFKFWEWSGNDVAPTLRESETFDRRLKPEGITRVSTGAQDFIFIVFDTSGYAATN